MFMLFVCAFLQKCKELDCVNTRGILRVLMHAGWQKNLLEEYAEEKKSVDSSFGCVCGV